MVWIDAHPDIRMKIEETVRVINDIARKMEIVGLTIAEPHAAYSHSHQRNVEPASIIETIGSQNGEISRVRKDSRAFLA